MPTLSIFFGIVIRMYHDDRPPPHFHAIYGEHEPKIALGLTLDWAELHREELRDNWTEGQEHQPLSPIQPLE